MRLKQILSIAYSLSKAKLLKKRLPLVVGWAITDKCNRRCSYCGRWGGRYKELSTEEVFSIVDTLAQLGTVKISFTGGEPLLREDMGKIIDYSNTKGIGVKLNSNGALVKRKIGELKNLDILNLSLEGPEDIHDAIRGKGSYQEVIEAIRIAKKNNIEVGFVTVLTQFNLNHVDFILYKAKEISGRVIFQPSSSNMLGGTIPNPIVASQDVYRKVIKCLIEKKRKGDKNIANSITGLVHLYDWPNPKKMKCASGWISCRIEPNGDVVYCSRDIQRYKAFNCLQDGFQEAFDGLKPIVCDNCWCAARVELNLAFSCNPSVIYNHIRFSL